VSTLYERWYDAGHDFHLNHFACKHCAIFFEDWEKERAPLLCPVNSREILTVERLSECGTKRDYLTYEVADEALVRSRRRDDKTADQLHVYRCRFCPAWHIGHKQAQSR
jgi:hypothetical protein